jgi:predicted Zn-dependent protease
MPIYQEVHDSYGVKQLGEGLIRQLPADQRSQYRFQFRVIDSKDVNAWAYPGGFIYITTSLIRQMKLSKEEIAAVWPFSISFHASLSSSFNP